MAPIIYTIIDQGPRKKNRIQFYAYSELEFSLHAVVNLEITQIAPW